MQIDIITLFPDIYFGPFSESIIARAIKKDIIKINTINLRDYTEDRRKSVDDTTYGGGPGMLMTPGPLFEAVEANKKENSYVILTTPQGDVFNQKMAKELSKKENLLIVCGHYEGIDERVKEKLIDKEISIGDYVLTSGNLPAMVIVDSLARLIPGVLGDNLSSQEESFENDLLEYPQYTKPIEFRGMKVPDILLSGNHKLIKDWRKEQAIFKTKRRRPDLYKKFIEKKKCRAGDI
ncbi:MAG TPA: tRNA (guanosine(37)-N1)-methyltransferase TrmD [Victivallales bacterium]|nr:tRNA (guanosine(37)-N1)-methyltransferase TrmD [Victivallales bacterium]